MGMANGRELLLTVVLAGLCLAIGLAALIPRMTVRRANVEFRAPDITVAIAGEVDAPGIYRLPFRSRVAQLIESAGGVTAQAEIGLVNLAATLAPGESVHVPSRLGETGRERISLNSATPEELERLPGVGPVTAGRIVTGRPYSRIEDLLRVKGIGEKTLERLRGDVGL